MSGVIGTFFDGRVARPSPVSVGFTADAIVVTNGEGLEQKFDLSSVRVSDRLGNIPRFIYLPNNAVIETLENEAIDFALGERQQGRGSRLIHLLESQQWIAVVGCVMLLATIAVLGYSGPPVLARAVAKRVPTTIDETIGTAALATISPYFQDSALPENERNRVREQLVRLLPQQGASLPKIIFRSMNGGLPNAFALPGNVIVVTDELVRLPASNDEIAAVLAHELGHLEKRHGLQSVLRSSFAVLIVAAVTGDLTTLTSLAGTIPLTILTAGYSRDLEREADHFALDLLRARQIKPRAFVTVLVKLEAAQASLQRTSTYLSTHPDTDERTALFGSITAAEREVVLTDSLVREASTKMERHEYASALADYSKAIAQAPAARTYALRAKCYLSLEKHSEAKGDVAAALALDANSAEAQAVNAGILALDENKYDEGIAAAQKALATEPQNATALAVLGFAKMMKNDLTAARVDLDRAIELSPGSYNGWAYRGVLRVRLKDPAGARADFDRAINLEPILEWLRLSRGRLRYAQQDAKGALEDFAFVKSDRQQTAEFFYERGNAESATGKADLAIVDYSAALDKMKDAPALAQVHVARGIAYRSQADFPAAIRDFDDAIAAEPKIGYAYFERAKAQHDAGDLAAARLDLDRAVEHGFTDGKVNWERAHLDWEQDHYAETLQYCNRALKLRPETWAYKLRGQVEFSLGDWERAEADFNSYLSMVKNRPQEYVEFFRLLTRRCQKKDDNVRAFAATIEAWDDGWAKSVGQYLTGQITGTQLLREANGEKSPTREQRRCEAYFYIGMTYEIAGDREQAKDCLEKCVQTNVTYFLEYILARTELARFGQTD